MFWSEKSYMNHLYTAICPSNYVEYIPVEIGGLKRKYAKTPNICHWEFWWNFQGTDIQPNLSYRCLYKFRLNEWSVCSCSDSFNVLPFYNKSLNVEWKTDNYTVCLRNWQSNVSNISPSTRRIGTECTNKSYHAAGEDFKFAINWMILIKLSSFDIT